jgi:hypothetical protein
MSLRQRYRQRAIESVSGGYCVHGVHRERRYVVAAVPVVPISALCSQLDYSRSDAAMKQFSGR